MAISFRFNDLIDIQCNHQGQFDNAVKLTSNRFASLSMSWTSSRKHNNPHH